MTTYRFNESPSSRHVVDATRDTVVVDGAPLRVQDAGAGTFIAVVDGRSERLHAVAVGDDVYVQLKGRAWRLERVDPTRSTAQAAATGGAGSSIAPMPGVVISLHAKVGQSVSQGDPLVVIESMKLQMTMQADADGVVMELPVAVGQTFQRGALLARTAVEGTPEGHPA
jgi:biotin carboxyl carrier protein